MSQSTDYPDHPWAGDGSDCTGCAEGALWKADRVAHEVGDHQRKPVLRVVEDLP